MHYLDLLSSNPETRELNRTATAALLAVGLISLVSAAVDLAFPLFLGLALDEFLAVGLKPATWSMFAGAVFALFLSPVFLYLTAKLEAFYIPRVLMALRQAFWATQLNKTSLNNLAGRSQLGGASLMSVSGFLERDFAELLYSIALILLSLIFLSYQSPLLTFVTLLLFSCAALASHVLSSRLQNAEEKYQVMNARFLRASGQPALNRREFYNLLFKSRFKKEVRSLSGDLNTEFKEVLNVRSKLVPVYDLTATIIFCTALVYLLLSVLDLSIKPGDAIAVVLALEILQGGLAKAGRLTSAFYRALVDLRITVSGISTLDLQGEVGKQLRKNSGGDDYALVIKELSVSSPIGHKLFEGLEASFPFGSVVAIVGANGAGKTSLLDTVAGIQPAHRGDVIFSKKFGDVNGCATIYYSPQDFALLPGGLLENIFCRDDHGFTMEKLKVEVCSIFGAEFFPEIHAEFDGWASNDETTISKGQTKAIAILRAYYSGAPVLLFDEVCAHLDERHIRCMAGALKQLRSKGLVLFATHDNSIIDAADFIVSISDGFAKLISREHLLQNN